MKDNKRIEKSFIFAIAMLVLAFVMLLVLNVFWGEHWLDSDMAAEMIFSKLIAEEGRLFTTKNWYYSTEFRLLYTQLFMVPLFHIFEDWHVIRTITNVLTYLLMLGSYFYFMKPLKVNKTLVVGTAVILLLPFSETFVTHMQMGNTYMPHVIIIFFCAGMFLRLTSKNTLLDKKNVFLILGYLVLNIICGMSGVRYMLALQVPLVLTAVYYLFVSEEFTSLRKVWSVEQAKRAFSGRTLLYLIYSMLGAFGALFGYVINVAVIAKNYPFQTYEVTNFIKVFQGVLVERMQDTAGNLLMLFGYIEEKGFLSLRGLISIIAFALLLGIVILVRKTGSLLKEEKETIKEISHRRFLIFFFVIAFSLNTFVFLFTTSTIVSRYYITVFMFVLPLLCFYFEAEKSKVDKFFVFLFLCACLGLSTLKCVYSFVDKDKNEEEKRVVAFLQENQYPFGFATYWNANIMTELSDGYVEIANITEPDNMQYFRWSSPMKYYEEGYYQGKTFILLTKEQWIKNGALTLFTDGRMIYEDEAYIVLHYDSVEKIRKNIAK